MTRLTTLIPGLGNSVGLIDFKSKSLEDAANQNVLVYDFKKRTSEFDLSVVTELVAQLIDSKRDKNIPY